MFKIKLTAFLLSVIFTLTLVSSYAQKSNELTVEQIMNAIIAPMTSTIWGAYEIETDGQWQELQNAAVTVIAAGNLLSTAGGDAVEEEWQQYNGQMITAARAALTAISNKDEEGLFNAGNDRCTHLVKAVIRNIWSNNNYLGW